MGYCVLWMITVSGVRRSCFIHIMKTLNSILLLLFATQATAQLTNGSFEDANGYTFTGWEWTCAPPQALPDAPTNGGDWCAAKEPGQTQGCFPSFLFQRVQGAQDGELRTLSGWVRCVDDANNFCLGAYLGFGTLNNGAFTLEEQVGGMDSMWTFVTITDTLELGSGDTAVVVLTSGIIGGPISPSGGRFDDLDLSLAQGLTEARNDGILWTMDEAAGVLQVRGDGSIRSVLLYDVSGKSIPATAKHVQGGDVLLSLHQFSKGLYLANVSTSKGQYAFRFAVR